MAMYNSAYNPNQGIFNNPRLKTWGIWQYYVSKGFSGWILNSTTNSFDEGKSIINDLLRKGTPLDNIVFCEFVPIDSIVTPSV